MRTSGVFVWLFNAPVLCLLGLIKHRVDSAQLTAPKEVIATLGGSVTVSCWYDLTFRGNTKYWCRGSTYELCGIVVKTPKNRANDRVFIADDKEVGVFSVTMTLLRESDEDMYWCVIAKSGRNVHAGVRLHVSHAATTPTTTSLILTPPGISLWAVLRWILLLAMLGCLVGTHMAVRRINAAGDI
ncbi:CMRF35-like molecule 3 [Kryptolebias marmoratus]|uniref:CMRF35-like molecule 3 n=1 Tax=Kryptolebias marmoratus TaxID=37003 RepID=A0A3Q3A2E6_KRYMA|nr:CMRF35-like molecule 3 [Kryptolebias marmoratus]